MSADGFFSVIFLLWHEEILKNFFFSFLHAYHSLVALKIKINEAEEQCKAIQEKLITVNGEAEALHAQCMSSKAEVQTRRKAVNEAEVGKGTD